jgi:sugar lactone lactonase YvrE
MALVLLGTNAQIVAASGEGLLGSTAQSITTIAGNGMPGSSGDGGPAVSAQLSRPNGVALDLTGALYISDGANNTVRKVVNPTSLNTDIITTIAGNGSVKLDRPAGVAVDNSGDVFIADSGNNLIREVLASSGTITTFAGNGLCGRRVPIGNGLPATQASLCAPKGVAVDGDRVYISDSGHAQVRVVGPDGVIQGLAGKVQGGKQKSQTDPPKATKTKLGVPTGLAVDNAHDVFIADTGGCVIREVQPNGKIRTVAGTGKCGRGGNGNGNGEASTAAADRSSAPNKGAKATKTELNRPTGVGVDAMGNLFIADTLNNLIREVNGNGVISTVAGTGRFGFSGDGGLATSADLAFPTGSLAISGSTIYFSDTANARVRGVFMGTPPVLPETQWAIALPLVALFLIGGVLLLRHLRRTRRASAR